ncbi:transcription elongation factor GreA [Mycoplasmatota bacterium]|nr:transcription elongation factor GreA [Mycoplasmatota bacterium]
MTKSKYEITKEGFKKFEKELEYLKTVKRPENIQALQEARAQGDLSENAEYDAARDEQAQIEARIVELENIIKNAKIIEGDNTDSLTIGKEVIFKVLPDGEEEKYHVVGSEEADPFNGKISVNSPVAQALIGHKAGETVAVSTPGGSYQVSIIDIIKRS